MLTRKPRKGDRLFVEGKFRGTVTRVQGDLCHYETTQGTSDVFIWWFERDQRCNKRFSLEEDSK